MGRKPITRRCVMRYVVANKPVRTMSLMSDFDRMMGSFFKDVPQWESRQPRVDIVRDEDRYLLTAELPGVNEDQLEIKIEENLLTLSSQLEKEAEKEGTQFLLKERSSASFKRSFVLPKDVDTENIEASFSNGILNLTMKIAEKAKPRMISIKKK